MFFDCDMLRTLRRWVVPLAALVLLAGCEKTPVETTPVEPDFHGWMELPQIPEQLPENQKVITHYETFGGRYGRSFTMMYDTEEKLSYWVAYPLHPVYFGKAIRQDLFPFDPEVPSSLQMPVNGKYNGYRYNSYQRGHQIPSADRTATQPANDQTFYITNMTPQNGTLNMGEWARLEAFVRTKASQSGRQDTLYVVTGCVIRTASDNSVDYLPKEGVKGAIPKAYFKVLLRTNSGKAKFPSDYDAQCIGFWMENTAPAHDYQKYVKTVAEIEALTGQTFFPALSAATKSRYWLGDWGLKQ